MNQVNTIKLLLKIKKYLYKCIQNEKHKFSYKQEMGFPLKNNFAPGI